jgi:peroxiredoxin
MISRTVDVSTLPLEESDTSQPEPAPLAPSLPIGNRVGQRAPDFSLPGTDGELVNLSDFRERVVLLEFWLSTCPGCVASLPHLETLLEEFGDRGFVVVLVSLDGTLQDAVRYLSLSGYEDFIVVHEARPIDFGTAAAFGVQVTPKSFLIDRSGVIRQVGYPSIITRETVAEWI